MILAVDIDGVIANTNAEMLHRYSEAGVPVEDSAQEHFKWEDNFGEPYEGWVGDQMKDPCFWLNALPYEDGWYMVNKWFADMHDVYFLTARWEEDETIQWLDMWDIPYNGLITNIKKGCKWKHVKSLGADIMIEDRPEEILSLAEHDVVTFVPSRTYNKSVMDDDHIFTVSNLYEVDEIIFGRGM